MQESSTVRINGIRVGFDEYDTSGASSLPNKTQNLSFVPQERIHGESAQKNLVFEFFRHRQVLCIKICVKLVRVNIFIGIHTTFLKLISIKTLNAITSNIRVQFNNIVCFSKVNLTNLDKIQILLTNNRSGFLLLFSND